MVIYYNDTKFVKDFQSRPRQIRTATRSVPPIALVAFVPQSETGDGHWVVVAGYEADCHPTSPDDEGCVVSALFMNNPQDAGDQVHPDHVTYDWWRRRYMKPVGDTKKGYEGSVVAVAGGTLNSA